MIRRSKNHAVKKHNLVFTIPVFTILIIYTLIMFFMLYLTLSTSLKDYFDYRFNPVGLPKKFLFSNYVDAFSAFSKKVGNRTIYLGEMFLYSFVYAGGSALVATFVPCVMAYLVAKYDVWFNKFLYATVIIAMTMPIVGAMPSEMQIMKGLGLYNTLFGPILMKFSYLGMYFLIFHGTFKSLSDEYIEAAALDGAGQWQVLVQIVFPLVGTTVSAVFLICFIGYWNDYQTPLVYMNDFPVAAVGLYNFMASPNVQSMATENMQMTGCMLLFIPIFILFLIFKNKLMGNLTVGGIKG